MMLNARKLGLDIPLQCGQIRAPSVIPRLVTPCKMLFPFSFWLAMEFWQDGHLVVATSTVISFEEGLLRTSHYAI